MTYFANAANQQDTNNRFDSVREAFQTAHQNRAQSRSRGQTRHSQPERLSERYASMFRQA